MRHEVDARRLDWNLTSRATPPNHSLCRPAAKKSRALPPEDKAWSRGAAHAQSTSNTLARLRDELVIPFFGFLPPYHGKSTPVSYIHIFIAQISENGTP